MSRQTGVYSQVRNLGHNQPGGTMRITSLCHTRLPPSGILIKETWLLVMLGLHSAVQQNVCLPILLILCTPVAFSYLKERKNKGNKEGRKELKKEGKRKEQRK